jgi:hypothetical protein
MFGYILEGLGMESVDFKSIWNIFLPLPLSLPFDNFVVYCIKKNLATLMPSRLVFVVAWASV